MSNYKSNKQYRMAGGIFVDQPFYPNPKCIVFALILIAGYWLMPPRNVFLLPLIFVVAYIMLAWYDYLYDCKVQMYSGTAIGLNTLDTWAKPQRRNENNPTRKGAKLIKNQEQQYIKNINRLHTLVIAPLLFYVGWRGQHNNPRIYPLIFGFGLLVMLYHGARIFYPRKNLSKERIIYLKSVYYIHLLGVAPLLLYLGYMGNHSQPIVYTIIMTLAGLAFLYHSGKLIMVKK